MKLDRNINPNGRGKYALVNMRKMGPIFERDADVNQMPLATDRPIALAFQTLVKAGVIHFGDESPGDQFFVMKYKDKFTAGALRYYAHSVTVEASKVGLTKQERDDLMEYANQIFAEAEAAQKQGNRIPD